MQVIKPVEDMILYEGEKRLENWRNGSINIEELKSYYDAVDVKVNLLYKTAFNNEVKFN
jgi:hypothetical protein